MDDVTPADLRRRAEEALKAPGKRRIATLRKLAEIEAELRPVVIEARRNEVPTRRISELTGLSLHTIADWFRKADQR